MVRFLGPFHVQYRCPHTLGVIPRGRAPAYLQTHEVPRQQAQGACEPRGHGPGGWRAPPAGLRSSDRSPLRGRPTPPGGPWLCARHLGRAAAASPLCHRQVVRDALAQAVRGARDQDHLRFDPALICHHSFDTRPTRRERCAQTEPPGGAVPSTSSRHPRARSGCACRCTRACANGQRSSACQSAMGSYGTIRRAGVRHIGRLLDSLTSGAVAQLVERFDGIEEARGSIPLGSTPTAPRRSGKGL